MFLIFLVTIDLQQDLQQPLKLSRAMIFSYWLLMIINVSAGRLALRTFQRTLLESGIGMRNTLIVGCGEIAREIFDEIRKFPALGYHIAGFIGAHEFKSYKGTAWLGELREIAEVIKREEVEEVIIAVENEGRARVTEVMSRCEELPVHLKIVPDLYDAVVGQVRTHQIYGLPLIAVMPEFMPAWERRAKRGFDIFVALTAAIFLLPLGLVLASALRWHSRENILTSEPRAGKVGKLFKLYQFRSHALAQAPSSSLLAFMYGMGWDKMPRLLNVLKGDLSLIGPRPETPGAVERLKQEIPFYTRRLRVQPGLTGWAQIKNPKNPACENLLRVLQYDFFYIENMSLRMDLKILLIALYDAMLNKKRELEFSAKESAEICNPPAG